MDKFWRRVIIASAVIITIIAITFYTQRPAATQYITAKAYYGDLADTVLATGKLDASERIDVGAQVSGQLKSLQVNAGDQVKKGQLIAEIDNLLQRNELRNARAALAQVSHIEEKW